MTVKIYGLISDNGDGSSSIHWFQSKEIVDKILDDSDRYENYYGNEGCPAQTLTLPSHLDLKSCGFRFSDSHYLEP